MHQLIGSITSQPSSPGVETLSKDAEIELLRRCQDGCRDALETLVQINQGYVVKVALEYRMHNLSLDDLVNEGKLGLMEAARRYDVSMGNRFITYAIWWIMKAIIKEVCNSSRMVRIPGYRWRMEKRKNPDSTATIYPREISLDERRGDREDRTTHDLLQDWRSPDPEASLIRQETGLLLEEAMTHLTAQERHVISSRYGLNDSRPRILKEIGEEMGISRERVRQIEEQAKRRLRRILARKSWVSSGTIGREPKQASSMRAAAH